MKSLFWILVLVSFTMFGQQQPRPEGDVKIGLVLSGGGAKGLAHIGVLKEIEKYGVRIDYIGGSSMGAIIGALYASGYSASQLDSIFSRTDFSTLVQDDLPRRSKSYNERKGAQRYAITLPFDKMKLSFPSGLSKGQNVYNLLMQLMYPVRTVEDFSQLPIPFFCTGTDIETGERLIFDHGSLARATLASGAIPSLFKPVEIDGRLVSDGGITDNYPVEEMRKRGVDFIIGVDVQDSLSSRKDLKTVFEILTQVNNFKTIEAMKVKRAKTDLYIKPDITEFSILSFDKGRDIITSGEKGAARVKEELQALAQKQRPHSQRPLVQIRDSVLISELKIEGNDRYQRSYIRGKLKFPLNQKITYSALNEGINRLSATGSFDWVRYVLTPEGADKDQLRLTVKENENRTALRFGVHYDQLYKSAVLLNITHKYVLAKNDRISTDFIVGDNLRYRLDYFVDKGNYWSIGLRSHLNQFDDDVDFGLVENQFPDLDYNINKIQLEYMDLTNQFFVETFFFKDFRFGMGFEHKYSRLKTETILLEEGEDANNFTILEKSHSFGPYGYVEYDEYDNNYFPNNGIYFRGDFNTYLFAAGNSFDFERFAIAKGKLGFALQPLSKLAFRLSAETGFQVGNASMAAFDFSLGGYGNDYLNNIVPFFGYDFNSLIGNSYIKATTQLDYQFVPKNHLMLGYNIANVGDNLFKQAKIFELPEFSGVSLGYGLETLIGPLELHYSFSPEDTRRSRWFVSLGFWF